MTQRVSRFGQTRLTLVQIRDLPLVSCRSFTHGALISSSVNVSKIVSSSQICYEGSSIPKVLETWQASTGCWLPSVQTKHARCLSKDHGIFESAELFKISFFSYQYAIWDTLANVNVSFPVSKMELIRSTLKIFLRGLHDIISVVCLDNSMLVFYTIRFCKVSVFFRTMSMLSMITRDSFM